MTKTVGYISHGSPKKVQLLSFIKKKGRVWQQKGWGLELIETDRLKGFREWGNTGMREDKTSSVREHLHRLNWVREHQKRTTWKKDGMIDDEACSEDRSQHKGSKNKWEVVMHMNHIQKKNCMVSNQQLIVTYNEKYKIKNQITERIS